MGEKLFRTTDWMGIGWRVSRLGMGRRVDKVGKIDVLEIREVLDWERENGSAEEF